MQGWPEAKNQPLLMVAVSIAVLDRSGLGTESAW
jgi:hypothetical protein